MNEEKSQEIKLYYDLFSNSVEMLLADFIYNFFILFYFSVQLGIGINDISKE